MHLKVYGINKMIPIAGELIELALGFDPYADVHVTIEKNQLINISADGFELEINTDGNVRLKTAKGKKLHIDNLPKIMHLLAKTQWCDPMDELPEKGEWCVVIISDIDSKKTVTITTAWYNYEDGYFQCDNNDYVTGWISADKAEL